MNNEKMLNELARIRSGKVGDRICYVSVLSRTGTGWTAGLVKDGERDFNRLDYDWNTSKEECDELVTGMNEKLGLSEELVMAMVTYSMFG